MGKKHRKQLGALLMVVFMLVTTFAGDFSIAATTIDNMVTQDSAGSVGVAVTTGSADAAATAETKEDESGAPVAATVADESATAATGADATGSDNPVVDENVAASVTEASTEFKNATAADAASAGTDVDEASITAQTGTDDGATTTAAAVQTGTDDGATIAAAAASENDEGDASEGNKDAVITSLGAIRSLGDAGAKGNTYTVKGIITYINGRSVYIDDSTGGICLYFNATPDSNVAVGKSIVATGEYDVYRGQAELKYVKQDDCIIEDGDMAIAPVEMTVSSILADEKAGKSLQAKRVIVKNVVIGQSSDKSTAIIELDGDTQTIIGGHGLELPSGIEAGDMVNMTCTVGYFDTVQLMNVTGPDVTLVAKGILSFDEDDATAKIKVGTRVSTLTDGMEVAIYSKKGSQVMTTAASGSRLKGTDATISADELRIADDTDLALLTVSVDENGNYKFTNNGKALTSTATGNGLSFADENDYSLWSLEAAGTDDLYYVKNVNAAFKGTKQALEYYNGFTTYSEKTEEAYQFAFYTVTEQDLSEAVIANGDYVIYNSESGVALSSEKSTKNSNYNAGTEYSLNASGTFDKVKPTEVWHIESKVDGSVIITQNGQKFSMDTQYASTPFDKVNDTWKITAQADGKYYIENIGRTGLKLEWYKSNGYFSCYGKVTDQTKGLFLMSLIPVTSDQIDDSKDETPDTPAADQVIADGPYFIYSAKAGGVMKYDLTGGVAASVSATINDDGKITFTDGNGDGAGVYTLEYQAKTGNYFIKRGDKYLGANSKKEITVSDSPTAADYWVIEKNDTLGGYTIANASVNSATNPLYFEYYGSKGFCLYTGKTLTDIYAFSLVDATGVANDGGYIGTKPAEGIKPENGKTYTIYCASGKSVIGPAVAPVDGASATMGAVDATEQADGTLKVSNGGLIFTVTKEGNYYVFENKGKYLTTNDAEELFLQDTLDDYGRWSLEDLAGGFLIKNKSANWNGTPVVLEYFSGGYAGYTFKATDADIFRFEFRECEDTFDTGYVVNPEVAFKSTSAANWGVDYEVKFTLDDLGEIKTVSAESVFEDGSKKAYTPAMDGYSGTFTIPASDIYGHTSAELTVSVVSKESDTKDASYSGTKTVAINDEPLITSVSPEPNSETGSDKRPKIEIRYANVGKGATIDLSINGNALVTKGSISGNLYTSTSSGDYADGKYTVTAAITRADGKTATKTWAFTVGNSGTKLYFGQIHSHTGQYSDGSGTLAQAYEYAMNKASDSDYLIVTDHSNYFDTTATATKDSIYDDAAESITKSGTVGADGTVLNLWQEAKATAKSYDESDGSFVAGYGYEMTWSGGPGHINVFNSKGIVSRNNTELNNKTNNAGMLAFYDLITDANEKNATSTGSGNIVAQFNHPGTTFGFFDSFTGREDGRDEVVNLIEVGNGDGSIGSTAYFPSYEYYDMALAKGWHVAPTNGQDNHKGSWGDSNTARTVALTDDFTEAGLYDAMSARHVYSTEDQNLSVIYYLGDTLQGGIIGNYDKDTVDISVSISDPDNEDLGYVYVIGENGAILYTSDYLSGNTADLNITLENTSSYYYVKVVQADLNIAVTAPVWVKTVTQVNAKVSASVLFGSEKADPDNFTAPSIGQAEKLIAKITNGEAFDVQIVDYSVLIDGANVANPTTYPTVNAGGNAEISYDWTPAAGGTHTFTVSFVVKSDEGTSTVTATRNIYVQGDKVSTIAEVKAGNAGDEFTVEGVVMSNASGYDKNTAFFDCIYIQDDTAGINIFPVSGDYHVGQKVTVHGIKSAYNGEVQLNVSSADGGYVGLKDDSETKIDPKAVGASEAMSDDNVGLLMKVTGEVTKLHEVSGVTDRIYVTDENGATALVYINGYIKNSITSDEKFGASGTDIKVGDKITAVGFGSIDVDELGEVDVLHRLRVRDRSEIDLASDEVNDPGAGGNGNGNGGSNPAGGNNTANGNGSNGSGGNNTSGSGSNGSGGNNTSGGNGSNTSGSGSGNTASAPGNSASASSTVTSNAGTGTATTGNTGALAGNSAATNGNRTNGTTGNATAQTSGTGVTSDIDNAGIASADDGTGVTSDTEQLTTIDDEATPLGAIEETENSSFTSSLLFRFILGLLALLLILFFILLFAKRDKDEENK